MTLTVFDSSASCSTSPKRPASFCRRKPTKARGELLSWMFFVSSGVGPYFGQSVHSQLRAGSKIPYAIQPLHLRGESPRRILDARLASINTCWGDTYTIVDMNVGLGAHAAERGRRGRLGKYKNLKRLVDEINARPAAQKANALKDRHKFKTEMDQEALHAMFPHMKEKAA